MRWGIFRFPLVFLALIAIAPASKAGQPAALAPLKSDMLDGSRLVLREAGCSVDVPATGWKWMTYEGAGKNYICKSPATELFLVAVGQLHGEFTDHQPESLIANARRTMIARGGKIENEKFEWVEFPGPKKCVRVTFNEIDKSGAKTLAVIYIAQTIEQVSVKLQYTGSAASEPDVFNKMVHSLKMLSDSGAAATKASGK